MMPVPRGPRASGVIVIASGAPADTDGAKSGSVALAVLTVTGPRTTSYVPGTKLHGLLVPGGS
jgi:hypothetical protein